MLLRFALLVPLLGSFACGGPGSKVITIESGEELNLNRQGKPTPVNVRIFQLTRDQEFVAADFDSLWDDPAAVLGETLVGSPHETDLNKSDRVDIPLDFDANTRFVGLMGFFNEEAEDKKWRNCVAVAEADHFIFYFEGYTIVRKE